MAYIVGLLEVKSLACKAITFCPSADPIYMYLTLELHLLREVFPQPLLLKGTSAFMVGWLIIQMQGCKHTVVAFRRLN